MGKVDYSAPLPEDKLIDRFKPPFVKLTKGYSATIVSIPHLGHTSHLRYLNSNRKILEKLGVTNEQFVFVDRDKVITGYESFASELLIGLNPNKSNSSAINSQNAYVLNKEITEDLMYITDKRPVIIAISVEQNITAILPEIENLLLLLQKSATKNHVSILWIADTKTAKGHKKTLPSSTFMTNIFLQKNFDEEETDYCLQRISKLKGKNISKNILDSSLELTGGFACTFHQYINTGSLFPSEYVKSSLLAIKKEVESDKNLVTKEGYRFLQKLDISNIECEQLELKNTPTAQEINILRLLRNKLDNPVSRDEIAQRIWGKAWNTKYSDWAIDKAISRLRKNIISQNYKLITVKNLGYELIKL